MIDTLMKHRARAEASGDPARARARARRATPSSPCTGRRTSTIPEALAGILGALEVVARDMPLVFPAHPRTREKLRAFGLESRLARLPGLRLIDPAGYLDFLKLMASARLVLTDSGGIQEETTILRVPCLTLRENTERPVTVELGTNQLVGRDPERILAAYRKLHGAATARRAGMPPGWDGHAAGRITDVLERAL